MENTPSEHLQGSAYGSTGNEVVGSFQQELDIVKDDNENKIFPKDKSQIVGTDSKVGTNVKNDAAPADMNTPGEVNMEASISADDIVRAGGFGARDDISSFLPVASDSTDFEASLLDARDYEEPQEEIKRPGLGWAEDQK